MKRKTPYTHSASSCKEVSLLWVMPIFRLLNGANNSAITHLHPHQRGASTEQTLTTSIYQLDAKSAAVLFLMNQSPYSQRNGASTFQRQERNSGKVREQRRVYASYMNFVMTNRVFYDINLILST